MLESARELREEAPAIAHLLSHAAAMDSLALLGSTECIRGIICPRCHLISDAAFSERLSKSTPASVCGACGAVFDIGGKAPIALKKRKANALSDCDGLVAGAPQTIKRVRDASWMAEAAAAAEATAAAEAAMIAAKAAAAARQADRGPDNRENMSLADIIAAAAPERLVGTSTAAMSVSTAGLVVSTAAASAPAEAAASLDGTAATRPQALLLDSKKKQRKDAVSAASLVPAPPPSSSAVAPGAPPHGAPASGLQPLKSLSKHAKPGSGGGKSGGASGSATVASAAASSAGGGLLGSGLLSLLGGSTAMPSGIGIGADSAGGFGGFGVGTAAGKPGTSAGGGAASSSKGKPAGGGSGSSAGSGSGSGGFSFRPLSGSGKR